MSDKKLNWRSGVDADGVSLLVGLIIVAVLALIVVVAVVFHPGTPDRGSSAPDAVPGAYVVPSASDAQKVATGSVHDLGSQYPPQLLAGDIKIGIFQMDYNTAVGLQQAVNQGQQPWRLDSELVLRNTAGDYGFTITDFDTIGKVASSQQNAPLYKISHKGRDYFVELTPPFPGASIWAIHSIEPR